MVALGASSRYLHALRSSHSVALLRLFRFYGSLLPSRDEIPNHYQTPGTRRQMISWVVRMRRYVAGNNAFSKFQFPKSPPGLCVVQRARRLWNRRRDLQHYKPVNENV